MLRYSPEYCDAENQRTWRVLNMFKRIAILTVITAMLLLIFLGISATRQNALASASEETPETALIRELSQRVTILEKSSTSQIDQDAQKQLQPDYSQQFSKMAAALEKMAEKSDKLDDISKSLEKIVERLTNIEEELAWSRIDEENKQ